MKRRHTWWVVVCVAVMLMVVAVGVLALWPLPTHRGVDYRVTRYQIPAYVKAMEFVARHWRYRELVNRIVADRETHHDRVRAIYQWTRQHIQPVPAHFPLLDDHIWHIIVRGYGNADQQADVFTTLCVYAGIPAFWRFVSPEEGKPRLVLSFVRLDHGWAVFAVDRNWAFYDDQGRLLTLQHVQQMSAPFWKERFGVSKASTYIMQIKDVDPPQPLRAHLQMPWMRLRYELQQLVFSRFKSWTRLPADAPDP